MQCIYYTFTTDDAKLAIGFGFTSFANLQTLPVAPLKIAARLSAPTPKSSSLDLVHTTYGLARKRGQATVAELVENEAILQILKEICITCGLDFYLG